MRLLRGRTRLLLQKVDMDGKMKKMAELQLTVVADPKNRKAIENQVSARSSLMRIGGIFSEDSPEAFLSESFPWHILYCSRTPS